MVAGRAVPILTINEDESFSLDEEALAAILNQKEIRNKPLCIIPVAGGFRKGKSFLLNHLLRYLEHQEGGAGAGEGGWLLTGQDHKLEGFHWCGGSQRDTEGLLAWSKVFQVGGVGVLLVDTQGAFDRKTSVKATITVFALALMTSSIFIYNLDENIQEDDLQLLQFFTQYGQLALSEGEGAEAPFNKLVFMVRDWQFPYEKNFGWEGGKQLLDEVLQVTEDMPDEVASLRKDLTPSFQSISSFLLPYPGREVTNPAFTGSLERLDKEFTEYLQKFTESLLSEDSITSKPGVKARDMLHYFKAYMRVLQSGELPEPRTMVAVTGEANNLASLAAARELYSDQMEEVVGGEKPYLSPQDLEKEHLRLTQLSMQEFSRATKMGGEDMEAEYRKKLQEEIEETYQQYKAHNEGKNVMNVAGTPLTLALMWISLYLISQIASLLFLGPVVFLLGWIQLAIVLSGLAWGASKYSGKFPEVGTTVDTAATSAWDIMVKPLLGKAVQSYIEKK